MEKFKAIPAVHLFLIKENKVLLQRRFNTGYEDGNYSVVAGHVDKGEPPKVAVAREAKEEAGIRIMEDDLEFVHIMYRNGDDWERVDYFFVCKNWKGEPKITEPEKCDDLNWFNLSNLPQNIIPYIKSAIGQYKNKINYSEFGW